MVVYRRDFAIVCYGNLELLIDGGLSLNVHLVQCTVAQNSQTQVIH